MKLGFTMLAALAFCALASGGAAAAAGVPPPDESHASHPIGVCGVRHFDARLEICDRRNNRLYRITTIDGQVWMAQNLDLGAMIPGSADQTAPGQKYCLFDDAGDCAALYQWAQAAALPARANRAFGHTAGQTVQGICPDGWHLPSAAEWNRMLGYVAAQQGAENQAVSLMAYAEDDKFRWKTNTDPDVMLPVHDRYGFSLIPTGQRVLQGTCPDGPPSDSFFCSAHDMAKFWTSDEDAADPDTGVAVVAIEDLPHVWVTSAPVFASLSAAERRKWIALAAEKASHQSPAQRSFKDAVKLAGLAVRCVRN